VKPDPIDFGRAVEELRSPAATVTAGQVEIWGGQVEAEGVLDFLGKWDLASRSMPWRIWEHTNEIRFNEEGLDAKDLPLLERGRLFGPGGDLSLRRDDDYFLWQFIGTFVAPIQGAKPFWDQHPGLELKKWDGSVLLWGAFDNLKNRWWEDRVGWADLRYPHAAKGGDRLWLHYTEFSDGGQVAFVWWKELKDHA
jgi:hypothetical protein